MSEYQYYEFRAVDRALVQREMRELRALSTRATITPTSFVNHYEWGNFKGDPELLMEKYFDAFIYVTNWGTRQLMLRLPEHAVGYKTALAYCCGESLHVRKKSNFIIPNFFSEDENRDWDDEDEGWMDSLVPLRADLMRGDLRLLYLGWLLCVKNGELSTNEVEPPVPSGLRQLTAPLESLARFAGLDRELIRTAAERSPDLRAARAVQSKLSAWIARMSQREKNALLLEVAEKGHSHSQAELLLRFGQQSAAIRKRCRAQSPKNRTVGELLESARVRCDERIRREAQRQAAGEARQNQRDAAARTRYLDKLAGQEAQVWEQVDALVQTKQPNRYDRAVSHLVDLRDLAVRRGQETKFDSALERLRTTHEKKSTFLRRLEEAGL